MTKGDRSDDHSYPIQRLIEAPPNLQGSGPELLKAIAEHLRQLRANKVALFLKPRQQSLSNSKFGTIF